MTAQGSEIKFLLKHSSIYGLGSMLGKLVGFILLPLYTRHLTPADYGILELIEIATGMIGLVVGAGLASAMSRFYFAKSAADERRIVVSSVLFMVLAIAIFCVSGLMLVTDKIATLIFDSDHYSLLFKIAFVSLAVGVMVDVCLNYLRMKQKSLVYIGYSLTCLVVNVALSVWFVVFAEMGVVGILYATLLTRVIVGLPVLAWIWLEVRFKVCFVLIGELLRFSMPLIPSQLANASVGYSDRFFINNYVSTADTGLYGLAQKLGTLVHLFVTQPFIMTFLPRRFEIINRDEQAAPAIFARIFDVYMLIAVTISLAVALYSELVIRLMTTETFYPAAQLIPIIALTMVIFGMKYHFEFGIHQSKKTYYLMYINMGTAALHIALNWSLIMSLGVWGALYAYLAVTIINTALIGFYGYRLFPIPFNLGRNAVIVLIACGIFTAASLVQVDSLWLHALVRSAALLFYVVILFGAGILDRRIVMQIRSLMMRKAMQGELNG